MTIEEIEALGLIHVGTRLRPRRFLFERTNEELKIHEDWSIYGIMCRISELAFESGIEVGKREKIEEIMNVLKIDD